MELHGLTYLGNTPPSAVYYTCFAIAHARVNIPGLHIVEYMNRNESYRTVSASVLRHYFSVRIEVLERHYAKLV